MISYIYIDNYVVKHMNFLGLDNNMARIKKDYGLY